MNVGSVSGPELWEEVDRYPVDMIVRPDAALGDARDAGTAERPHRGGCALLISRVVLYSTL